MILDDQLMLAPTWTKLVLSDPEAAKYVSGIAIHWYMNRITPRFFLDVVHKLYPQQFIISSEACEGFLPKGKLLIPFELTRMCCLLKKPYYFYFYSKCKVKIDTEFDFKSNCQQKASPNR